MLFGEPPVVRPERARGAVWSATAHVALGLLALAVARHQLAPAVSGADPVRPPPQMVWVPAVAAAAGGGGQGGGNQRRQPPRRAEAPGHDRLTMRPTPPVDPEPTQAPPTEPELTVALSAEPVAAGLTPLAGILDPTGAADADSTGAGTGPGSDGRDGAASGPGQGLGIGSGDGREMGDVGPPGNGVSWPRLVRDVRPAYTAEAMRARISGSVGLSCVVDRDGSVRDCRLTRSLDRRHGLDQAAIRAARLWRFLPARRQDEAVPVRVTIDMDFSLR
jgi:protein TonB